MGDKQRGEGKLGDRRGGLLAQVGIGVWAETVGRGKSRDPEGEKRGEPGGSWGGGGGKDLVGVSLMYFFRKSKKRRGKVLAQESREKR